MPSTRVSVAGVAQLGAETRPALPFGVQVAVLNGNTFLLVEKGFSPPGREEARTTPCEARCLQAVQVFAVEVRCAALKQQAPYFWVLGLGKIESCSVPRADGLQGLLRPDLFALEHGLQRRIDVGARTEVHL